MFETVWQKSESAVKEQQEAINMISAEEATCVSFSISCHERQGKWAIWFHTGNFCLQLNPIDLANSIFVDGCIYSYHVWNETTGEELEGHAEIQVNKWNSCFSWRIYHTFSKELRQMQFTYTEYVGKIKQCLQDLFNAWTNGAPVDYDKIDASLEGVEMCLKQLEITATLPSCYKLMTQSVVLEQFVFTPGEKAEGKYTMGLGDRNFQTFFTPWHGDFDSVRHQLEQYVYDNEAEVKLEFDLDDTIVKLKHVHILDQINKGDSGVGYKYKEYLKVEIHPNHYVNFPIIKGYSDEKEVIRRLYEGLLIIAGQYSGDGDKYNEEPSRLVTYNRCKSPVIESFLKGEKIQYN